jgi:hypothetical protein
MNLRETDASAAPEQRAAGLRFTHPSGSRPLDGYTIKRGVGRGGFGEVYFAISDAGKEVALKLIRRNLDVELRGVSQCLNLKHPNLVILYDIKQGDNEDSWVIMEYVAGECLDEIVARNPEGMPIPEVLAWMHGTGAGVAYLHDRGIVHRDLKPGNIFCDEGIVKIGDYGLSKFISCSRRSGQTESVGTVHYMAPEVANGRYGKEIDVYALGIMLYEMLTGHVPFEGESVGEVLMKHLTAQPDVSRLPDPYRMIVARALAKDPEKRFRTVGELLAALPQPAGGHVPVNPQAVKPRIPEAIVVPEPVIVQAQVVSEPDEPIWRAMCDGCRQLRQAWRHSNMNAPMKAFILVALVFVLVAYFPAWISVLSVLGISYAAYLVVRMLVISPASTPVLPAANGVPVPGSPIIPAAAHRVRRPPHRSRAEQIRALLTKDPRKQLTDLLGSLLLSALVTAALCVVLAVLLPNQPQWNQLVWLGIVGTLGAWALIVPSKFWELRDGEPMIRRFALLLIGLCVGLLAYSVDAFLLADPRWDVMEIPYSATKAEGYQRSLFFDDMTPNLKGYLAYFAFLFPVLRWWKQADPMRSARLSLWSLICVAFWAWLLHVAWPFPQPWGVMVAVAMSVAVQLGTPWISIEERRRVGLPLTREE